jgi:hypothetical protein
MTRPSDRGIGCEATPKGSVKLYLIEGEVRHAVDITTEEVGGLLVALMATAVKAAQISGKSAQVGDAALPAGIPYVVPTAIALSRGRPSEPLGLVVQVGMVQFALALASPRELGEALLAAATDARSQ